MFAAPPWLEADRLAIAIGGHTLARDLSFRVEPGQCWAIVGPNGAGKTTLLRTLAGLSCRPRARCATPAFPSPRSTPCERARDRAFLPQDSIDPFPASVLATVLIGRHPHLSLRVGGRRDLARAQAALVALRPRRRLPTATYATLSGGERRRVALAALFVQDAPLALLDEPSSHLDIAQQTLALDVFVRLARERAARW